MVHVIFSERLNNLKLIDVCSLIKYGDLEMCVIVRCGLGKESLSVSLLLFVKASNISPNINPKRKK